ncbi:hypothetical protein OsI_28428 [Oryza sativa Indica Group]|uniref:Uncharacterized protein n=1 Tax=Oryza sativa subsp. indica TaxID=39946 RepID=B8B8P8_ORYSI|nr:hypothetical protein OsI_28428 [Oryza sativa Indica Group]
MRRRLPRLVLPCGAGGCSCCFCSLVALVAVAAPQQSRWLLLLVLLRAAAMALYSLRSGSSSFFPNRATPLCSNDR